MFEKLSTRLGGWANGWLVLALVATLVVWEAATLPILQAAPGRDINPLGARYFVPWVAGLVDLPRTRRSWSCSPHFLANQSFWPGWPHSAPWGK